MKAAPIPAAIRDAASRCAGHVAPNAGAPVEVPADECLDRDALAAQQGARARPAARRTSTAATRSIRASFAAAGIEPGRDARSRGSRAAAADDQGRAGRRPGRAPALGHDADRAARALHALLPDLVHHRPPAAVDRHQRELAVDARVLEGGLSRRARRRRAIASSSRSRSGRSSASGPRSTPRRRLARTPSRPAACRASCAWR